MTIWLTVIAGGIHLMLIGALVWYWRQKPHVPVSRPLAPRSVIIAAHNECENLKELLPILGKLEGGEDCEFILVLDRCSDGSGAIARQYANTDPRLRVLEISEVPDGIAPKKHALSQGIAASNHENLVFTDADCRPEADWLQGMGRKFANGADLVLGLGPYEPHRGMLNAFIRHETFYTALLYIGAAKAGRPYMGVGRNLGYTKSLWKSVGGFAGHQTRLSGDDDLFVNAVSGKAEVAVLLTARSRVWSAPERTWGSWFKQKQRHLSAGIAYPKSVTAFLGLLHGLQAIFYLSLILVLCGTPGPLVAGILYLIRTGLAMALLLPVVRKWNALAPIALFPVLDLGYILYHLVLIPASLLRKPKWKAD